MALIICTSMSACRNRNDDDGTNKNESINNSEDAGNNGINNGEDASDSDSTNSKSEDGSVDPDGWTTVN